MHMHLGYGTTKSTQNRVKFKDFFNKCTTTLMYMHLCSSKNEAPHIFASEKIKNENPNVLHKQIKRHC